MQQLRYSRYFKGFIILADLLTIALIFAFFAVTRKRDGNVLNWDQFAITLGILLVFWILLSGRTKLYSVPRNTTYTVFIERLITHVFLFLFGVVIFAKVSSTEFIKTERFVIAGVLFIALFFIKSTIFFLLKWVRGLGINHRNIMFLGNSSNSQKILENIFSQRHDYGFKIFDYPAGKINSESLVKFWREKGIHTLYLPASDSGLHPSDEEHIFRLAEIHKVRIALIPNLIQEQFFAYELSYVETQPVLIPAKFPLDYFTNHLIKRVFDVIFSVLILVLIGFWLFPLIALLVKTGSKGPVFFRQQRYGYHDEIFTCLKFRTMIPNGESSSKTTEENDSRITAVGKFLRRTSLDEMPQFINVLKGEMSVVGPRPHMLLVDDHFKPRIGRYAVRSLVKPGITGLAQVNGLRGDYGDMNIEMEKRVLADSFYVKNWTFVLDMVIILRTVLLWFTGDKKAR